MLFTASMVARDALGQTFGICCHASTCIRPDAVTPTSTGRLKARTRFEHDPGSPYSKRVLSLVAALT